MNADAEAAARPHGHSAPAIATSSPPLLMVEFFSRGGLFHYALQLGVALARRGERVLFLTARNPEFEPAPVAGFTFLPRLWTWDPRQGGGRRPPLWRRAVHAGRYCAMWIQIVWFAWRLRPGALLFGDFEHRCDAWFCAALRRLGTGLADVCHNVAAIDRRSRFQLLRRTRWRDRLLGRLDLVFVHGAALAAELTRRSGRQAIVIPHGAGDLCAQAAGPDPGLATRLGLVAERPVALLFGTLTKYKGIEWFLQALALVPSGQRPEAVIAGFPAADAELDRWQAQARALGIDCNLHWVVEYIPWQEVAWYFRLATFVVLPYYCASQSGVAHLALSFGRALIASNAGVLAEVVMTGENGLVVPIGDVGSLGQAIARLTSDRELCLQMGQKGAELAGRLHDWDCIADRVRQELAQIPIAAARTAAGSHTSSRPWWAGR